MVVARPSRADAARSTPRCEVRGGPVACRAGRHEVAHERQWWVDGDREPHPQVVEDPGGKADPEDDRGRPTTIGPDSHHSERTGAMSSQGSPKPRGDGRIGTRSAGDAAGTAWGASRCAPQVARRVVDVRAHGRENGPIRAAPGGLSRGYP